MQKPASTAPRHSATRRASTTSTRRLDRAKQSASSVLDSLPLALFGVLLTLLILFLDDFRIWLAPKSSDSTFGIVSLIIFIFFVLELIINSLVKKNYFLQFFFWLDLLSALSLIPDIPMIWSPIIGIDTQQDLLTLINNNTATYTANQSNPTNRIIRLVRLIRLVRIAKLFELCAKTGKHGRIFLMNQKSNFSNTEDSRESRDACGRDRNNGANKSSANVAYHEGHSAVGQHLSEQTTRKVVLLVLLMLFGIPLLQPLESNDSELFSIKELNLFNNNDMLTDTEWQSEINFIRHYYGSNLLYLNVNNPNHSGFNYQYVDPSFNDYRISEMIGVQESPTQAFFSRRSEVKLRAEYDVITNILVLILLSVGAILFNRNNHRMVIVPIERMMATIVALQQNPLAKATINNADSQINNRQKIENNHGSLAQSPNGASDKGNGNGGALTGSINNSTKLNYSLAAYQNATLFNANSSTVTGNGSDSTSMEPSAAHTIHASHTATAANTAAIDTHNETGMLERTLEKLTGLLQVGFGEAGSKMIQKCMNLNADGDLDPLVDGTKMLAIFGFCDIRRFTDATECLKEDVMMYVNEIAAIVHSQVSACDGHPNKNIGDAFLLVWRLPSEMETEDIEEFQKLIATATCTNKIGHINSIEEENTNIEEFHPQLSPSAKLSPHSLTKVYSTAASLLPRSRANTVHISDHANTNAPIDNEANNLLSPSNLTNLTSPVSFNVKSNKGTSLLRQLSSNAGSLLQSPLSKSVRSAAASGGGRDNFSLHQALQSLLPPRILSQQLRSSVSTLADKSLVSFLRIIVEINASDELKRYALNPRIAAVFNNFQVELGFGLHVGWAIEGPIGSRYKIDASYLSPHVNLAETLEGTTKVYGVPLLLSGEFHALLSPYVRALCRRLDRVKVSGREKPMTLYTFDIDKLDMEDVIAGKSLINTGTGDNDVGGRIAEMKIAESPACTVANTPTSTNSHASTGASNDGAVSAFPLPHPTSVRAQFLSHPPPASAYHFVRSSLISQLQSRIPLEFYSYHTRAMDYYLAGDWEKAEQYFAAALDVRPIDQPTKVLLDYIREANLQPPDAWQGCREM